jgi:hypothetical protein
LKPSISSSVRCCVVIQATMSQYTVAALRMLAMTAAMRSGLAQVVPPMTLLPHLDERRRMAAARSVAMPHSTSDMHLRSRGGVCTQPGRWEKGAACTPKSNDETHHPTEQGMKMMLETYCDASSASTLWLMLAVADGSLIQACRLL